MDEDEIVSKIVAHGCTLLNINCKECPLRKYNICTTTSGDVPWDVMQEKYFVVKTRLKIKAWKAIKND